MIAITGKSGAGKTYYSTKLRKLGYKVFIGDEFNNIIYSFNNEGYNLVKNHISGTLVNEKGVDKPKLVAWILEDFKNNLEKLKNLIEPLHFEHLKKNKYDFAELALITKESNFRDLFLEIIFLNISENKRKKNLIEKRKISLEQYLNINKKIADHSEGKHFFNIKFEIDSVKEEDVLNYLINKSKNSN
ncbi:dephospho-CoA kinase [[Mycoplasma] mobile]|uniref:Hypothetical dephospho-CoA kinase n=1 Tax=Mycoplasma mobile (strain ATCC 43663 / 163K / NCTC 11711) TaxID=267748 RepID=Q6KH67_MYCM1|nr:dephospho-CoA kinase [[Mycoplasma] mobile]AAT28063.1 hypothetical dephospho-CoA kinase [Mycoplasma mobile 163K]